MQIRSIILYSNKGDIRRINFRLGGLSIVTGASKTGKSALIEIVDYCLGREACTIPVGVIRDAVSWFAVLLQFQDKQYFVARRPPEEGQQYQSEVYVQTAVEVTVPSFEQLKPNSNTTALESELTALLGISPNLNISATGQKDEIAFRINVRHTTFFILQQQDEIASRKLLFHRQGDEFVPHAIRQTLPYFVGAVAEDRLVKLNELERLRSEAEDIGRRIQEYERTVGNIDRARDLLREAQYVGLLQHAEIPNDRASVDTLLARTVVQPLQEAPSIVDDDRDQLQRERLRLMREYRDLREQIKAAEEFEREQLGFKEEVTIQAGRLRSIELFPTTNAADVCPVCLSKPDIPTPTHLEISALLESMQKRLRPVQRQITNVREHVAGLHGRLAELRRQIDQNWIGLSAATAARKAIAEQEDSYRRRSYVAGRISLYLQSRQELFGNEPLEEKLAMAKTRIVQLEEELAKVEVEEQQASIFNAIGAKMSEWGKQLNLEYSTSPLRIDIRKLNVVADTSRGPVPLDRMGGGENWVGYHLVAFAALHSHFVAEKRPVPRFLMLDQPSQVYFPQDRPVRDEAQEPGEDEIAVSRIFNFLHSAVTALKGDFQIIVMDHADLREEFFQGAVIQRWRKGEALIPPNWLTPTSSSESGDSKSRA
jgi:hypothetical protein